MHALLILALMRYNVFHIHQLRDPAGGEEGTDDDDNDPEEGTDGGDTQPPSYIG